MEAVSFVGLLRQSVKVLFVRRAVSCLAFQEDQVLLGEVFSGLFGPLIQKSFLLRENQVTEEKLRFRSLNGGQRLKSSFARASIHGVRPH